MMVWKSKGHEPKQDPLRLLPAQMETPGFPSTSKQQPDPDGSTKFKIEAGGIKPKVEPCEEEEEHLPPLPPPVSDDDWEVTPLSGEHPFFTTVLSKSQVQKQFQLVIPARLHRHLPEARVPATLLCRGRSWAASYCGDLKCKKIDAAWRDFAVDNGLRVGDACVFELVTPAAGDGEEVVFRVQVLRGDLPEEITSKGATSDEPLVIVD
ncbi:B3 domain-containing protein Os06g0112300 isoform X2 [Setaria italica]|uniref:B3 domain-containing protein Os06g0112300 isoform X2 n=1 Tax=Setaria italica TaxID=4555 RepID=UPI000BE4DE64|nr:B3 domain-containing protein Os06g0112300 isoform X2 [Setaria italica]XP_034590694.1 B3 domain-containing protein Os06g0112300-like isoform X2 [Setaria viridis]